MLNGIYDSLEFDVQRRAHRRVQWCRGSGSNKGAMGRASAKQHVPFHITRLQLRKRQAHARVQLLQLSATHVVNLE